ncbi:Gfo/Idh/MocA family oxidoreductase, partial [Athalassotoga sp.]|uniref:Gfo/Idh/MocA family oxidoreductase n=1 Tax=Athalassotoga sp. TaxID=2022597 RepID=UPI003CFD75DD
MVRMGILGIAHMHGYSYVSAAKKMKDIEVVGLYDQEKVRAEMAAKKLGIKLFDNLDDLIKTSDGLIVTSENSMHGFYV